MKMNLIQKLYQARNKANEQISRLTNKQRSELLQFWDIEHVYYSSTLEGSKLDRKDVEELAHRELARTK